MDSKCNLISKSLGLNYQELLDYCIEHAYQDPRAEPFEFTEPGWWGSSVVSCSKLRHYEFDINPDWYSSCKIELISETMFDYQKYCYVTEKSFKSIFHGIPFIIAGYPGGTRYLEDLGFKTFDKYCKWPNQDLLPLDNTRLEMIIDNIQSFIESDKNTQQISDDIDYNKNHLAKLTSSNLQSLQEFLHQKQIHQDEIDQIVMCIKHRYYVVQDLGWSQNDWQHAYSAVKDCSWPECSEIQDIANLPENILDELKNLHHFVFELNNFSSANKG